MLTAKEKRIVKKARKLIRDKRRWTRGEYARTCRDVPSNIDDRAAYKFCAYGAIVRTAQSITFDRNIGAAHFTARHITQCLSPDGLSGLTGINDSKNGHRKVLALFDKALAD